MALSIKKKKKADICDVTRCRMRGGLIIVDDAEHGKIKICDKHIEEWGGEAPPAAAPPPPPSADPAAAAGVGAAPVVAMNHTATLALIEPTRVEAETNLEQLKGIQITSQNALDSAGELLQEVKGKAKALETQRTSATRPLLDAKSQVDSWFKPAKDALAKLEKLLKDGISRYITAQENARLAALQAGQHETALAVEQPALPSGVQARTVWKYRIVDETQIPRDYLVVDAARIQLHVNTYKAQSSIPGVEVYPDNSIAASSTPVT